MSRSRSQREPRLNDFHNKSSAVKITFYNYNIKSKDSNTSSIVFATRQMNLSCLLIVLIQLSTANPAESEKDISGCESFENIGKAENTRCHGKTEVTDFCNGEQTVDEEEGGATGIRQNGRMDFENKQAIGDTLGGAKEEEHIEERIAKRLEELGISKDDISSLPVVSRCLQLSNMKKLNIR